MSGLLFFAAIALVLFALLLFVAGDMYAAAAFGALALVSAGAAIKVERSAR